VATYSWALTGNDANAGTALAPKQTITVYVSVPSADKAMAKVKKLGGTVCAGKTAVPGMGYFAICADQEENVFALWEPNERAA